MSLAAAALAVAIVACEPVAPLPRGAEQFDPPPLFEAWWGVVEQCSGLTRPIADVSWYSAPAIVPSSRETGSAAYYDPDSNRIVMGVDQALNGDVVRHEMLHALIDGRMSRLHPRAYFLSKCAGIVSCDRDCVMGSDPASPDPFGTVRVKAETLEITASVQPLEVSLTSYDHLGYGAVWVTATNKSSRYVVVDLADAVGFSFATDSFPTNYTWQARVSDASGNRFAPGETKRQLFDLYLLEVGRPAPGTYSFHASYGPRTALSSSLKVVK